MVSVTADERDLLTHVSRWGSDGYPVKRVGSRHWSWSYRDSINTPAVYKTKREAVASFEAYHSMILDRLAGRVSIQVDKDWCFVCDRPKNDCACVENGGNY